MTEELLGPNLEQKISDSSKVFDVAKKLMCIQTAWGNQGQTVQRKLELDLS